MFVPVPCPDSPPGCCSQGLALTGLVPLQLKVSSPGSSSALNFDYRAESACVYSRTFNRVSSSALNFDYRAESACVYSRTFSRVMGYEVMIWYMRTQYSNCM
ncbi:hypothetical protein ROHU_005210 [Labeo rohita]|uniref:Uncharacterized protein n=1 Tax=Labeo rohita TaxID=84645 RepID=A0A498NC86_LABRO|nr:hypothetical protein ROHU_005210 [Labeo rohita]